MVIIRVWRTKWAAYSAEFKSKDCPEATKFIHKANWDGCYKIEIVDF